MLPKSGFIALCAAALPTMAGAQDVHFKNDVYPILRKHCFACHRGSNPESGVRLDHYAKLLGKTDGIPLLIPGKASSSRLIQVVKGQIKGKQMPPADAGPPLTKGQINLLSRWIDQGAKWDEKILPDPNRVAAASHWAFQPVQRPAIPGGRQGNPIDAFIAARLKSRGLQASPRAAPRTLIRRAALALRGFPLPAKEVNQWLVDKSGDRFARLVDRLLKSPHYGERIARHWLDYARWAESEGFAQNSNRNFAWRYRDYVVKSFNEDKPYSQFIRQQIAGDELEPYSDENVIATGFLAAARISADDLDFYRVENDMYVDMINTLSSSVLGLTVGCSQCHDHKFDPISQLDFYRLRAFFTKGLPGNVVLAGGKRARKLEQVADELLRFDLQVRRRVIAEGANDEPEPIRSLLKLAEPARSLAQERLFRPARIKLNIRIAGCNGFRIKPNEKKKLDALRKELGKLVPKANQTWAFYSPITSPHRLATLPMVGNFPLLHDRRRLRRQRSYLLKRGRIYEPIATVQPGWPSAFGPTPKLTKRPRTALADWIVSKQNPLTARVWVNRIWQMHFGRGLVETSSNFGLKGSRPTHPALLDWLAAELMAQNWSTRHIHRLIVTSRTWQQSSRATAGNKERDPENRYLWRWPRRRLEYEAIRDSMLAVSGELNARLGGASTPVSAGVATRRSLYLHQRRDAPPSMQVLFDGPTAMSQSCSVRRASTSPLQSLFLLNNSFAADRGRALARRIKEIAGNNRAKQIQTAFELVLGRPPDATEAKASRAFLNQYPTKKRTSSENAPKKLGVTHGLGLWLRADQGVISSSGRKATDGDSIRSWLDQTRGDNRQADDLTQTVAHRQPLFFDSPASQINGLPIVRFSGGPDLKADHFLRCVPSGEIDGSKGYTLFTVTRFNGKGLRNEVIFYHRDVIGLIRWGADGRMVLAQDLNGTWGDRIFTARPVANGTPVVIVARWRPPQATLEVYGTEGLLASGKVQLKGTLTAHRRNLFIGGYALKKNVSRNDGERLNADIGEVLFYDRSLSDKERSQVAAYLRGKWLSETDRPLVLFSQAMLNLSEFFYIE